ncbi:carbon-phosphorus lyase complex subunit PhnI [Pseudodesulfovibrio sediminis]|uniref:Carbon-phosphorus lyase complex subunit PhnI n=1 Tax=Pseudodesulfovibrio sediminis TaxID=2810563 RepID=A0ABN6EXB7_9BACT|nr:carbon-phosphorus lyase complex subunit PhnI [Pseudodesulfovibrio sediminis]BCS89870.1 carbon-phosphorus lyase complex subunit PhnI [Pseudodesulfovibrio sediminis]
MYVAVKGGEIAIDNAHRLMAEERRGDITIPELTVEQILQQMRLAVDRVMSEGSLYDPGLAALAIKQSRGDLVEAIFLLRAYRTTLPRLYTTQPIDTTSMQVRRRISATFKDIPGGQLLGPTFDYTHRLLDFSLAAESRLPEVPTAPIDDTPLSRVMDILGTEGLVDAPAPDAPEQVGDITQDPVTFPVERDIRLQNLARGDEGFLLALGYSSQRGFGDNHPFAGEIRMGEVAISIVPDELGFEVEIGDITVSECEMVTSFVGSKTALPKFTRGYGLSFGYNERKAMAMSLVDRSLQARELGEDLVAPSQDEEFVLSHSDNVEAQGFVQHLKLPHYVDFQADLVMVRSMREAILKKERHTATPESEEAA